MKALAVFFLGTIPFFGLSQSRPVPFSESSRAIEALRKEPFVLDSLKRVYKEKFTLNFSYGQRFLLSSDISSLPDTITNADFTDRRSFYGLGVGYFIKDRWSADLSLSFTILPKDQEFNTATFEGSGNGGVAINIGVLSRYYFLEKELLRPYVSLYLGTTSLRAVGGEGSLFGGQDVTTLSSRLMAAQLSVGFGYRLSPGLILDYNIGLTKTSRTNLIGGVTSYGGITTSLNMQFVLNHKK